MPSTVISKAEYDPSKEELIVTFVSGMVYVYEKVPESEYTAMITSGAKGIYFNKNIKGKYTFRKIDKSSL